MGQQKIYTDISTLQSKIKQWQNQGLEVVFTNGCFDIIHMGHVYYLAEAKALGDKLVVAINSDESIRRIKGNKRPITNIINRQTVLSGLESIDAIIPFDEDTPLAVITYLKPDILAKGGDYKKDEIVGAQEVLDWGGSVNILPFIPGISTSIIESKIIDSLNK